MRTVKVVGFADNQRADEIYPALADFEKFQTYSDVVREVRVTDQGDSRCVTHWEVNFRQGVLCWSEEDRYFPDEKRIEFRQIEGDPERFEGEWNLADRNGGCQIKFSAEFDMGIPSLEEIVEPIAEQALKENIQSIITGIVPGEVEFESL